MAIEESEAKDAEFGRFVKAILDRVVVVTEGLSCEEISRIAMRSLIEMMKYSVSRGNDGE